MLELSVEVDLLSLYSAIQCMKTWCICVSVSVSVWPPNRPGLNVGGRLWVGGARTKNASDEY
jgi:hypothetical protein